MANNITFNTRDLKNLEKAAKKIDGITKKQITPAVRKAMSPVLKIAKQKAPENTGNLKKALKLKGERTRTQGKKVYQVTIDKSKNDIFVKISKNGNRAYYPASQEHGFATVNGGRVDGKHYLRDAMDEKSPQLASNIIENVMKNIEKEWEKRYG